MSIRIGRRTALALGGTSLGAAPAAAQPAPAPDASKPQYGGTLEIATEYPTLSALSWDPYDWNWKVNQEALHLEHLLAGDLTKAASRGGKFPFRSDAWVPPDALRGELAEGWELVDEPLSVVFRLRRGVMWQGKPGVMAPRELVAEDVAFSFNRLNSSPKKIPEYFDFVDRVEAKDKHTVVFHLKEYNAEWDYRLAWGYYSAIVPKEMADAGGSNWRNATGTGPFTISEFIQGNSQTYKKNPNYWDTADGDGKLPYVDQLVYRTIRDEATQHTALRTGKIDMLRTISWRAVDNLKRTAPQLQWSRGLAMVGTYLAMRVDSKPFDDIRVRRALNMAVNKQEIINEFYGGNAEMLNYPMHKEWAGLYQPLDEMPASVRELFTYDPAKARKLLAEAGLARGFSFKCQVNSASPTHMDLLPLVAAYLEQVGVKMEIQTLEYGAFLSAMTTKRNAAGYLMDNGHTNPTTSLRKNFMTGQTWNPSQHSDPKFDERIRGMYRTRDEGERAKVLRELTVEILDKAPYIWLPSPYVYQAWWPWVKNYGGEMAVGAVRPGPIYARIWIDQELKKKLGF